MAGSAGHKNCGEVLHCGALPGRQPDNCAPWSWVSLKLPLRKRMAKERIQQNRRPDQGWQDPKRNMRQFAPQWQVWSIIHIEIGYHQNVGRAHSRHMNSRPSGPKPSSRRSSNRRSSERQAAQREQVIVVRQTRNREHARCDEHDRERTIIDRPSLRVASMLLSTQHGDDSGNHANQSRRDVQPDKRQKERRI
jgi:hypothetical protein